MFNDVNKAKERQNNKALALAIAFLSPSIPENDAFSLHDFKRSS